MLKPKTRFSNLSNLFLPLSVLAILIIINLIKGADYFRITVVNGAFYETPILFGASELGFSRGDDLSFAASGAGHQHR